MGNKITTKNRIIMSCKKLMKIKGYRKTTMTQIVEDVGINLSLLNYYFPKKEDLLINIMAEFLNSIYYFALLNSKKNALVAYIATNYIYYDVLINQPEHFQFYQDILDRPDRNDLSAYTNFDKLYFSIIKFLNINVSFDELVLREISIFGANRELLYTYFNQYIDITFEQLVEEIAYNTCTLLDISDYLIKDSIDKAEAVINKLQKINFRIFG